MSKHQVPETLPYIQRGTPSFKAILFALFLAGFAIFSSLYCVQPMMPFLTEYFHISAAQSSFPLSVSTMSLAIGLLFTGMISDRFGRKPVMVAALFSAALFLIAIALFHHWTLFLVLRVLIGLAISGVAAVTMTYIGEEIAQQDVGFAMGLYISGTAIGGMSGRLIAGLALDYMPWYQATLCVGILNLCIAALFCIMLPASKHFRPYPIRLNRLISSFKQTLTDQKLLLLFLQGFVLMGCFVSVFNYISFHLLAAPFHLSQSFIGLLSVAYLAGIYSSPRAAKWASKYSRSAVILAMLSLMLVGALLMLLHNLVLLLIGLLLFTFSFFAAHSTASSWVSIHSAQSGALGSSLYLFSYYLGSSVLGSSSGLIWQQFNWIGLIALISLLLVMAWFFADRLRRLS